MATNDLGQLATAIDAGIRRTACHVDGSGSYDTQSEVSRCSLTAAIYVATDTRGIYIVGSDSSTINGNSDVTMVGFWCLHSSIIRIRNHLTIMVWIRNGRIDKVGSYGSQATAAIDGA